MLEGGLSNTKAAEVYPIYISSAALNYLLGEVFAIPANRAKGRKDVLVETQ